MLSSHLSPWHKIIHLILITSWCYYYRPHLGVRMYLTFPMKNETQRGSIILRSESGRSRFWTHAVWLQSLCVSPLCSTDYGKPSPWDGNWLAHDHTADWWWKVDQKPNLFLFPLSFTMVLSVCIADVSRACPSLMFPQKQTFFCWQVATFFSPLAVGSALKDGDGGPLICSFGPKKSETCL